MMTNEGCQGVYVNEQNPNILMFMYADDIGTGTDTVSRMKKILNVLAKYCKKWSWIVSIAKTKILVFRRGGKMKINEKWWFDGTPIEVVDFYKYLGVLFTSNLIWSMCKKTLSLRAKKNGLHMFYKYSYQCGVLPRSIAITLFDKMILPIVLYGSEVWGSEYSEICESVQYDVCRIITGLSTNSSKLVLLSEMGRYPLALHYSCKLAIYSQFKCYLIPEAYLKIINMRKYLIAFSIFRCSNHQPAIEQGRHSEILIVDNIQYVICVMLEIVLWLKMNILFF